MRESLAEAACNPQARSARRAICETLSTAFNELGNNLHVAGHMLGPQRVDGTSPFGNGDDRLVGIALVSMTASALVKGIQALVELDNAYAASALCRQLVEVEYLAWAFAEDHEEAAAWLRSSREERLQRWQPRHLRDKSGGHFRGKDYAEHCEVGGHPTPQGARVLLSNPDLATTELLIFEAANHSTSGWRYLMRGVNASWIEPEELIPEATLNAVGVAESAWREADHLGEIWGLRNQDG